METALIAVGGFVIVAVLIMAVPLIVQRALTSKGEAPTVKRGWGQRKCNSVVLWRLILLAVAYGLALNTLQTLTGSATAAGTIGLALGLFICAHPAANAMNILFFERDMLHHLSEWSVVRWLVLNLLVLLARWMVIFLGLRRLVDQAALELIP